MLQRHDYAPDSLWLRFRNEGATPADIIDYFDTKFAPVPVFDYSRKLGVRLIKDVQVGCDGEIYLDDTMQPTIIIGENEHVYRQRFALALQLGVLIGDFPTEEVEHRSTVFAANLLMPRSIIDRYVRTGLFSVEKMAQHFMVSPEAMVIRLESL